MGLIEKLLAGAIGYGISEVSKSHPVRDAINNHYDRKISLEDLIDEYARRYEIYTVKNEFARHLHQIAEKYEEYDYDEVYGRYRVVLEALFKTLLTVIVLVINASLTETEHNMLDKSNVYTFYALNKV